MSVVLRRLALEPFLTGPLLLALRSNSPRLAALLSSITPRQKEIAITTLKWLLTLGVVSRINRLMTAWALNNWKVDSGSRAWIWDREIAVVTGGSSGIGLETVKNLAATDMKVVVIDVTPLPPVLKSLSNVSFYECDITQKSRLHEVATKIQNEVGAPSILINNAGIGRSYDILEASEEHLNQIFAINTISHWFTVQEFLPDMIKNKKGHIVTIASMASFTSVAGMAEYCATKASALAFHEGLTQELKHRYNAPFIKMTSVHPYWVQTALLSRWENSIKSVGTSIMTPEFVASHISKAVLSGSSGRLLLPPGALMPIATAARSLPMWFAEAVRDATAKVTIGQNGPKKA